MYLGVLRALRANEGNPPSSEGFLSALEIVEAQTETSVSLVRGRTRNLIRNSGQYWKALDLLDDTRGGILLTEFGRKVADGDITPTEFATTAVKTLRLPNRRVESPAVIARWQQAGLTIKPLELILSILAALNRSYGSDQAYIASSELTQIVIPLAGEMAPVSKHAKAIAMFREGSLDISTWPDCTPGANDRRMANEYLLFLCHYGFLRSQHGRYYLEALEPQEIEDLVQVEMPIDDSVEVYQQLRLTELPAAAERRRVTAEVLARPNQAQFRREVLQAYQSTCLLTGVRLPAVLVAAHIVPVKNNGTDTIDNGMCLRSDIHLLFDTGHLRLKADGTISLSESATLVGDYRQLPEMVDVPSFVSLGNLQWRWTYT